MSRLRQAGTKMVASCHCFGSRHLKLAEMGEGLAPKKHETAKYELNALVEITNTTHVSFHEHKT